MSETIASQDRPGGKAKVTFSAKVAATPGEGNSEAVTSIASHDAGGSSSDDTSPSSDDTEDVKVVGDSYSCSDSDVIVNADLSVVEDTETDDNEVLREYMMSSGITPVIDDMSNEVYLSNDLIDGAQDTIYSGDEVDAGLDIGVYSNTSKTTSSRPTYNSHVRHNVRRPTYMYNTSPSPRSPQRPTDMYTSSSRAQRSSISSLRSDTGYVKEDYSRKRRTSIGVATDTWHLNRYQTSVPVGWFQQLRKRVCVKFAPRSRGSTLCYCGKSKEEHTESATLEEEYGDCVEGASCIVSKNTDAIIKYKFENDSIESLFIRLDYKTSEDHLSFLLKQILRMRDCKLLLHFLDFEEFQDKQDPSWDEIVHTKLCAGLQTLANKTKLAITSTGLHSGVSRHVHNVLKELCQDQTFHSQVFRLACPPWGILPKAKRKRFVGKKMSSMKAYKSGARGDDDVVMDRLSAWFNHYLLYDEGTVFDSLTTDSSSNASVFRDGVEKSLSKRNEDAVNVFIMINGGRKVLDHVVRAIERNVPVIIVMGTGGYATKLAINYLCSETVAKKILDENGVFKYRSKLIPPKHLMDVEQEDEEAVMRILENNHLLTIFDPTDNTHGLDMVIYQALLKSQKQLQLNRMLSTSQGGFMGFESQWMDFLLEAMLSDSPEVVDVILKKDPCLETHFTTYMVIKLYNRRRRLGCILQMLEDANAKNVKHLGVSKKVFCPSDVRLVLQELLHDCYPLTCTGVSCQCVLKEEHTDEDGYPKEQEMYRTCLPPVQEMFLWTLLTNHQRLAKVIWKHCEDKLASALVATVLLSRMAENEDNTDRESKLQDNAKEFGDIAVELLRTCYELDEKQTHVLMRKKSTWWGNQSVMELAYNFRSRKFISQPAAMSLLDRIWMGRITTTGTFLPVRILLGIIPPLALLPIINTDTEESKGFSMKEKTERKRWPKLRSFYSAPVVKHMMHVISFVMFLVAFSYVLLVDLQPQFTAWQGVLCIWVATYSSEEVRQLLTVPARSSREKFWQYWKDGWNQIDVICIGLFVVGMTLAVIPYDEAYHFRRVCLSIDFIFFCMRLLQAFSIGSEIGPMLTMILKMIRTTVTFVIILFVIMISYAVASESILFPRASPESRMIYYVPRKAYWQVYGEFFLGEIEGTEHECTNNPELYTNHTLPRCPSKLGQYMVPVLMAIYCIVTHVLMLNLLIAKFNDTYTHVQGEAKTHWAWYRCLVFYEFTHRRFLPPPLNIITWICWLIKKILNFSEMGQCRRCCPRRCRDWWSSSVSTKKLPLVKSKLRGGYVGPTSIELCWKCPRIDTDILRYRILCYVIQDALQGIPSDNKPDLAVTLYSNRTASTETYTVNNLAPHTLYRLVVLYENKTGWHEYDETQHNTIFREITGAVHLETECVEQLDKLQTEDPVQHKLEAILRTVNTMEEQFTKSINQVTGHITQLQHKEDSVREAVIDLRQDSYTLDNSHRDFIHTLISDHFETVTTHLFSCHSELYKNIADFETVMSSKQETEAFRMQKEISELRAKMTAMQDTQVTLLELMQKGAQPTT